LGCSTFWIRGEYLHWWTDGLKVPPLVTSSPAGTPQNQAGILGQPSTSVLFGDADLNDDSRSGGRFAFGCRPAGCHVGLEVSYLVLEQESAGFQATGQGDPILARPFFNVETELNDAYLVAFSDLAEGSVSVAADTEFGAARWWRGTVYGDGFLRWI
jgi:hypothetical protein